MNEIAPKLILALRGFAAGTGVGQAIITRSEIRELQARVVLLEKVIDVRTVKQVSTVSRRDSSPRNAQQVQSPRRGQLQARARMRA